MRDLGWNELLDLIDGARSDEAWVEIRRRILLMVVLVRGGLPALTLDDLEDLVQHILLRLQDPKFVQVIRLAQAPHAYLLKSIRHNAIDLLRRTSREVALETDMRSVAPPAGLELTTVIATLPVSDQALLHKRFWLGMKIDEIAKEMNLPYSTVAKRLFRLAADLRKTLQQNFH